jgi:hypothetical protein
MEALRCSRSIRDFVCAQVLEGGLEIASNCLEVCDRVSIGRGGGSLGHLGVTRKCTVNYVGRKAAILSFEKQRMSTSDCDICMQI